MYDAQAVSRRRPRALIVDDDPAVVKFLHDRCVSMGLEVQGASNGLQALIMARRDPPDVLIIDVHIPELDGLSLCSTLLEPGRKSIDVIVVSGSAETQTMERCRSLGASYAPKGPKLWKAVRAVIKEIFPGIAVDIEEPKNAMSTKVRERPLVLVIDDDPDIGKFLISRLRKCGVDAVLAADGRQGYQIAVRETPSVVISDYFMPMADINFFLWRLRSTPGFEKTPVFAMTGYDLDEQAEKSLTGGVFGRRGVERIFKKPLNIDELFVAVQRYCALKYQRAS
jgi:CheY-like chemotaxis protein